MAVASHAERASEQEWSLLKGDFGLSRRQAEILHRILHAKSDGEIARELGISVPAVHTQMTDLLQKFDVNDRAELLAYVSISLWACRHNV